MSNSLKDLGLTSKDLKAIAQVRGIKDNESMSEGELLSAIIPSKKAKKAKKGKKQKTSFSKARIEEIREEFNELRYKFSKLKIKEIRKNLYEIENEKNLSESKRKEIEKNLTELEENLLKLKNNYDYDDIEYREIRNVRDLFDLSIDEDYYKPIIVKSAFHGNYIQYESKGEKGKFGNKSWIEETSSEWKIQLTMAINFISSKDSDETRTMQTKRNNVETMISSETNETIKDLFESFLQKYQEGLKEPMTGSEFVYDSVDVLYYNLNKVSLNRGGSYIDSPKWAKNKKATINPQNKEDDKCFQYALSVALNYEKIKKDPQRISKLSLLLINTIGMR